MPDEYEDNIIIEKCKKGDKKEFAKLIDKYKTPIIHLAYRMTWNIEDANDIAQTTFLKAYENIRWFNTRYSFFSWIYTICLNICKDILKKKRLSTISTDSNPMSEEDSSTYEIPDTGPNPLTMVEQKETMREIMNAINSLPEKYQQIVVLRHIHEYPYEDIAKILHMPVGTVKIRLYRARNMLKIKLKKLIEEEP